MDEIFHEMISNKERSSEKIRHQGKSTAAVWWQVLLLVGALGTFAGLLRYRVTAGDTPGMIAVGILGGAAAICIVKKLPISFFPLT